MAVPCKGSRSPRGVAGSTCQRTERSGHSPNALISQKSTVTWNSPLSRFPPILHDHPLPVQKRFGSGTKMHLYALISRTPPYGASFSEAERNDASVKVEVGAISGIGITVLPDAMPLVKSSAKLRAAFPSAINQPTKMAPISKTPDKDKKAIFHLFIIIMALRLTYVSLKLL